VRAENSKLLRVLGGISGLLRNMGSKSVLSFLDVVALHGFPLDWNHWSIHEWPDKIQEIRDVTSLSIWVSEVGVSTFGAEEVHWYSLYDLPAARPATTRHREATAHRGVR
jgi:beta-xylosidase